MDEYRRAEDRFTFFNSETSNALKNRMEQLELENKGLKDRLERLEAISVERMIIAASQEKLHRRKTRP